MDIDWEEDVPQNEASYVSLIKNLRATFQREFPKPVFLSADVDTGQVPPGIAARIAPYVNSLNMETFQDNGISSAIAYTNAGIPASKLLMGIGVASGYYDTGESRVEAKVRYVEAHGLGGTLLWQPGNLNTDLTDPRLIPLERCCTVPAEFPVAFCVPCSRQRIACAEATGEQHPAGPRCERAKGDPWGNPQRPNGSVDAPGLLRSGVPVHGLAPGRSLRCGLADSSESGSVARD